MRETEGSLRGKILRDLIAHAANDHLIGKKVKNGELRRQLSETEPPWKCPDYFELTPIEMPDFKMELLQVKEGEVKKDNKEGIVLTKNNNMVILQLHGGGYVAPMRNAYRMFAGLYVEVSHGMSVLSIDYRVAPEHPYPAALMDAFAAFLYLQDMGYEPAQILLAGDSAGGGLALALCHYLKDQGMKLPGGIVAMSPWTDLTASGESYTTNYERDPLFGNTKDSLIYNNSYAGDNDRKLPYLSPLYGDFSGFPPMLVQVGSYEMLLSDSVDMVAKARAAGVKVHLSVYDGMFHIFQMAAKMLPESKRAWVEIGKFIEILNHDER